MCLARLTPHIVSSFNFNSAQSAYRTNHSTETALLKVTDDLYRIMDQSSAAVLIALDLSAAFDTIEHRRLIDRLQNEFGVAGVALEFIRSYLSGRTQCIGVGGDISTIRACSTGIPQGSVFGPFLFSIYTSPIGDVVASHDVMQHQYADDANMYAALKSKDDNITIDRIESCATGVMQR